MKLLLHIGQSKTGTSALQHFLSANRKVLSSAKILYPGVRVGGRQLDLMNHNTVADSLTGRTLYPHLSSDTYFKQFFAQAEAVNAEMMILSGEHFIGGHPRIWEISDENVYFEKYSQKLSTLARYLEGHDVSVIAYLRPHTEWLASAIAQTIRIEKLIPKGTVYESDQQFFAMAKPALQYGRLLDMWENAFSSCDVVAVPYDRAQFINNSVVDDFITRAGMSGLHLHRGVAGQDVNVSLSREYLEVKKRLNAQARSKTEERVIIHCLEKLSRRSRLGTSYQLDERVAAEVAAFVAEDTQFLNSRFVKGAQPLSPWLPGSDAMALTEEDIEAAMSRFQTEYRHPRSRLLAVNYDVRRLLRQHAMPVHAFLHGLKGVCRSIAGGAR